jgi:nanoRNase/pAp phosphatase (c-di-AMP/oligoRNAs hydrolase)
MDPVRAHRADAPTARSRQPHEVLRGPVPPGRRPLDRLAAEARAAVEASGGLPLLVLTHKSPDPDALGSCVGMARLIDQGFGLPVEIATTGRIFRAENLAMVRELGLSFEDQSTVDPGAYAGAVLVDTQPHFGHTSVPEGLEVIGVVDHHIAPEGVEASEVGRHVDVRTQVGSTSSLVHEYLRDAGVALDGLTAAALFCGVRFDTADLAQDASSLDEEAYYETFRRADKALLARIQRPRLPHEYYRELSRSLRLARRHGPVVVALLGQVKNPESVAEMADFFLRMEGTRWCLVGGAFEGQYYVSLRTLPGGPEAYDLLAQVLVDGGSFGGHGRIAGGQLVLEDSDALGIRRVERRLRRRVVEIIDPEHELDEESRHGRTLA